MDVSTARTGRLSPGTRERLLQQLFMFKRPFPKDTQDVEIKQGGKWGCRSKKRMLPQSSVLNHGILTWRIS